MEYFSTFTDTFFILQGHCQKTFLLKKRKLNNNSFNDFDFTKNIAFEIICVLLVYYFYLCFSLDEQKHIFQSKFFGKFDYYPITRLFI